MRNGTVSRKAALSAIGFGLIGGFIWFWMLIPPLVAFAVLWFGIVRRGLVRELVVPAT